MSEKTEKATAYKLRKAKEKGRVSKSNELTTCLGLFCLILVMTALWPRVFMDMKILLIQLINLVAQVSLDTNTVVNLNQFVLKKLLVLWLPLALSALLAVVLATLVQTGFIWTINPLIPDFKRLHLIQGFKRFFSTKLLFDAGKNVLKFSLATLVIFIGFKHEMMRILHLVNLNPSEYPSLLMALFFKLTLELMLLLLAMSVIDKLYTHWKFGKDNRMSKQEVKDEYRQREGDPSIKAKIKSLQQQLRLKTASLEQVKTADVLITNPTHIAIALQYKRSLMPAPKVVCKVQGELVHQVKLMARKHGVPIVENKFFARALYASVALNQWINREHFPIAAMIFREIYSQKEVHHEH